MLLGHLHRRLFCLPILCKVGSVLISVTLLLYIFYSSLFAQSSPIHIILEHTVETAKAGIMHPTGLTFVADRSEFLIMTPPASLPFGGPHGVVAVLNQLDERIATYPIPATADPMHIAYDSQTKRLFLLNPTTQALLTLDWEAGNAPDSALFTEQPLLGSAIVHPHGMAIDAQGQILYLLDSLNQRIVAYPLPAHEGQGDMAALYADADLTIAIPAPQQAQLRGLAFHPGKGTLVTLDVQAHLLYELSPDGNLVQTYDLTQIALDDPQSIVFAPSRDSTDDPASYSLFIADRGIIAQSALDVTEEASFPITQPFTLYLPTMVRGSSSQAKPGRVVEVILEPPTVPVIAATSITSVQLVRSVDTGAFLPSSPDPSGLAYIGPSAFAANTNRFMIVDGEVEEFSLYKGANMYEVNISGQLVQTYTTVGVFSNEPVGVAFNPNNGHYYISDDDKRKIFDIDPGPDKQIMTVDDTRSIVLMNLPNRFVDTEGVSFGMVGNITPTLFVAGGENSEIYTITPGPNGLFGGAVDDDVFTHFDISQYGLLDSESVEYDPVTDHIYAIGAQPLIGRPANLMGEFTRDGQFVRFIDIAAANPMKPAGLAIAPSSQHPGLMSFYIVDRGIDNNTMSGENDGRLYELTMPGNQPPIVNAGADQNINFPASATLNGSVIDDALPAQPGIVTATWSVISGPGAVSFGNASLLNTTATFAQAGIYVLRLTASDGQLTATDDITIMSNTPPLVNAGADQIVGLDIGATLNAVITDDGLPAPPATVSVLWSIVSGPGNVIFANANARSTSATFAQSGVYILRVTANDGLLSLSDDISIIVKVNEAPTVNVGADQTIAKNETLIVTATIRDDGLPNPPSALTYLWEKVSGSGTVAFGAATQPTTTVTFGATGSYTLRLTVSDGQLSRTDVLRVKVTPPNNPPTVSAGADQTIVSDESATLSGSISDDGMPNPPGKVTIQWQMVSGPGRADFANARKAATTVSFSAPGVYVLRLGADDSRYLVNDDITILVNLPPQAPIVSLGANRVITLSQISDTISLSATIEDDDPSSLSVTWRKVSGPGKVTFAPANAAITTIQFSEEGSYEIGLRVSDDIFTVEEKVTVTIVVAPLDGTGKENKVFLPIFQR